MDTTEQHIENTVRGVTISEAARRLGVSERTIYRYVKNGRLKTDNTSGKIRVLLQNIISDEEGLSKEVRQLSERFRQYDERFNRVIALLDGLRHEQGRLQHEIDRIYLLLKDALQSNERLQQALVDLLKAKEENKLDRANARNGDGHSFPALLGRILKRKGDSE
ncbi:DNA-binding protein, excisionase family [Chthonomonas calidirosea]|uniref:DNA binding domain, excisionase family n=1 Tax=Chthonomonas calidirosea (strain DSM 23976 / ICMP 18418 / T49) TaxID=1303518 RepID=S0EV66_CHTCT|nr:helix-turn-helix domain-containing protein [Chthonomonas calidirosea]CCW34242.1 DNA binding domain, excisionase family [Chthonomonas calidirosea T49]CEK15344.1 DNA-binding protein, excisionase family [Chthonomonas calidirosea]